MVLLRHPRERAKKQMKGVKKMIELEKLENALYNIEMFLLTYNEQDEQEQFLLYMLEKEKNAMLETIKQLKNKIEK